jgi:hypothetical protein
MVMATRGFELPFLGAGDFMAKEMFAWQIFPEGIQSSGVRIQGKNIPLSS